MTLGAFGLDCMRATKTAASRQRQAVPALADAGFTCQLRQRQ
ncbi:MAG TPA: hypothetical protein VEY92_10580 [Pseudoxanthomonas sp.]|nr:hypothetical protein [Pseudoxanthomonas sp.]